MQSSDNDQTQVPAEFEWATTQLIPPRCPPPFSVEAEITAIAPPAPPPPAPPQPLISRSAPPAFRWSILRWGVLAIAATTLAQTSFSLFTRLVAPTFARQITQAQVRRPSLKISAMNQAQQVYFLDHGEFSSDLVGLDLGIVSQGQYYDYRIQQASKLNRRRHSSHSNPEIVVSLAVPKEPGLPILWGAIAAQAQSPSGLNPVNRIADSLICQKPAPKTHWSASLRQSLGSQSTKRRNRHVVPAVPLRLECPTGFEPSSFSVHS